MKFELRSPCADCPFLREGGIRLRRARIDEICGYVLGRQGGAFPCHKTTISDEGPDGECVRVGIPSSQHCAGALIFAEKHGTATQLTRIMERLGAYDASKLVGHERVFDSVEEMLVMAVDGRKRR